MHIYITYIYIYYICIYILNIYISNKPSRARRVLSGIRSLRHMASVPPSRV